MQNSARGHFLIPQQTPQARATLNSNWAVHWERIYRQVFWLADGRRNTERIATLLHKDEQMVRRVSTDLCIGGYFRLLMDRRKDLQMNAALLKESFEMIPDRDVFAQSFYNRLFTDFPETRQLFQNTDMRRQANSLMATLAVVVSGVERGDNLAPVVRDLGARHQRFGAQPVHYPIVGALLLETFHEQLGMKFTPEMQDSWSQAYEVISNMMMEGANEAPSSRS